MTSIKSMAGLLHTPSAKASIIVALRAYFDESGTHWGGPNACDVFVLCGYIAPESLWDDKSNGSFLSKWGDVMHGKPFHATEMESNPQGASVKLMLANVVNGSGVIGIRGGISIPAFQRLLVPYIHEIKGKDDPYLFLFADVIAEAVKRSTVFIGENQGEPIGFVFANQARWSVCALEFYNKIKSDPETPIEVRSRMGGVAFDDIDQFIPLQAADHLAFETYHYMTDPTGTSRPAMNRLMDWPQNYGNYYNERGLLQYIQLCKRDDIFP